MPKKLKTHAASFKFKVVLESFTSNNVAETARKYSLNANQLSTWRGYFLEQGHSLFQTDVTKREQEFHLLASCITGRSQISFPGFSSKVRRPFLLAMPMGRQRTNSFSC